MKHPARPLLVAATVATAALAGCADTAPKRDRGEAATWAVDTERPPQPTDKKVLALVSRVECANGRTGRVLAPVVMEDDKRVVVTFTVERTPIEDASCPGNKGVRRTFSLEEPLGDRTLYDGYCLRPKGHTDCVSPSRQVWPILR
jgi:hypothetical protein